MSKLGFVLYIVGLCFAFLFMVWSMLRLEDDRRAQETKEDLDLCDAALTISGVLVPATPAEIHRICGPIFDAQFVVGHNANGAVAWDCSHYGREVLGLTPMDPADHGRIVYPVCLTIFPLDLWEKRFH